MMVSPWLPHGRAAVDRDGGPEPHVIEAGGLAASGIRALPPPLVNDAQSRSLRAFRVATGALRLRKMMTQIAVCRHHAASAVSLVQAESLTCTLG